MLKTLYSNRKFNFFYLFLLHIIFTAFENKYLFAVVINNNIRSDIITIKALAKKSAPQMPPVCFLYGLHTDKLEIKTAPVTCKECHKKNPE